MREAPWVLYGAMRHSIFYGKIEVVKWLFESLVSPNERGMTLSLLSNKNSTLEDCQWPWLQDFLFVNGYPFILHIHNPDIVKWLLTTVPSQPGEDNLNCICKNTGNVELTQWLVTEHNFTPTAATFESACSTSTEKGSTLARWLSTRVSLSQTDITKSMVSALSWGNIKVAEWLDETFHVMDAINSSREVAENFLVQICSDPSDYTDRVVGLEWFLQHLSSSQVSEIKMSCVHKAVSQALQNSRRNSIALLLKTFSVFEPHQDQRKFKEIVTQFMQFHLAGFQHLCSTSSSTFLTPELVGQCLTSESFHPYSSKVVKWVIHKFNLQYSQIKQTNNLLLFKLMMRHKNRCAQWLIESFDIPLLDIVDMAELAKESDDSIDLTGWHMILDHYGPAIDGDLIWTHFLPLVSRSPHVAIHTINSFGLASSVFHHYVDAESSYAMKLWLGIPFS
ncbi:hypothetical protein Pelo_14350 [Pelomyxa schiedti]|nr:hypothetical protein Pelo_14350 [Pelomyxa schiedti]